MSDKHGGQGLSKEKRDFHLIKRVMQELLSTESSYCEQIGALTKMVATLAADKNLKEKTPIKQLCDHLDLFQKIHTLSTTIREELRKIVQPISTLKPEEISSAVDKISSAAEKTAIVLQKYATELEPLYAEYCSSYDRDIQPYAVELDTIIGPPSIPSEEQDSSQLSSKEKQAKTIRDFWYGTPEINPISPKSPTSLSIAACAITPVQRIPRYRLLLNELIKYSTSQLPLPLEKTSQLSPAQKEPSQLSLALTKIATLALNINEAKAASEFFHNQNLQISGLEVILHKDQDPIEAILQQLQTGFPKDQYKIEKEDSMSLLHRWLPKLTITDPAGNSIVEFKFDRYQRISIVFNQKEIQGIANINMREMGKQLIDSKILSPLLSIHPPKKGKSIPEVSEVKEKIKEKFPNCKIVIHTRNSESTKWKIQICDSKDNEILVLKQAANGKFEIERAQDPKFAFISSSQIYDRALDSLGKFMASTQQVIKWPPEPRCQSGTGTPYTPRRFKKETPPSSAIKPAFTISTEPAIPAVPASKTTARATANPIETTAPTPSPMLAHDIHNPAVKSSHSGATSTPTSPETSTKKSVSEMVKEIEERESKAKECKARELHEKERMAALRRQPSRKPEERQPPKKPGPSRLPG